MVDPNPARGMPLALQRYWLVGKGALKIRWNVPGDFLRCVRQLRKYFPTDPEGLCNILHTKATGGPPGHGSLEPPKLHHSTEAETLLAAMPVLGTQLWAGPIAAVGRPTGEPRQQRQFEHGALKNRTLPLPLAHRRVTAEGHMGAVTVGRVLGITYGPDHNGMDYAWGWGDWLDEAVVPEVTEAKYLVDQGVVGPSIDPGGRVTATLDPTTGVAHMTDYTIAGVTLVPIAAFTDMSLTTFPNDGEYDWPDSPDMQMALQSEPDCGCGAEAPQALVASVNNTGWRGLPLAPREAVFDNDLAVKRIQAWAQVNPQGADVEKLKRAFMWHQEGQPETDTTSYRLPFGDVINGKLTLIYHAIYAAAALISGAHGGLPDIPEADKAQLRNVISEIYPEMAKAYNDSSIRAPWDRSATPGTQLSMISSWTSGECALCAGQGSDPTPRCVPHAGRPTVPDASSYGVTPLVPTAFVSPVVTATTPSGYSDQGTGSSSERPLGQHASGVRNSMQPSSAGPTSGPSSESRSRSTTDFTSLRMGAPSVVNDEKRATGTSTSTTVTSPEGSGGSYAPNATSVSASSKMTPCSCGGQHDMSKERNDAVMTYAVEAPYGDVKYADPGYRDNQKRYPIDTPDHIRAAWAYINVPKNAGMYDKAQLDLIKGRIMAAAKKAGIQITEHPESQPNFSGEYAMTEDGYPITPPAGWFEDPELTGKTPITVDADGRLFGHLAAWGECHRDVTMRECVLAPKSKLGYAPFHLGTVLTAEGDIVRVGKIVMDTRHADIRLGYAAAALHYDNTGDEIAVVRAGEDEYGIWVAGSVVPEATPRKVAKLRRSPLSGDWRREQGNLELTAALAVNAPAFPVYAMENEEQLALVAAGTVNFDPDEYEEPPTGININLIASMVQEVLDENEERQELAARLQDIIEDDLIYQEREKKQRLTHLFSVDPAAPAKMAAPAAETDWDTWLAAAEADAQYQVIQEGAPAGAAPLPAGTPPTPAAAAPAPVAAPVPVAPTQ